MIFLSDHEKCKMASKVYENMGGETGKEVHVIYGELNDSKSLSFLFLNLIVSNII